MEMKASQSLLMSMGWMAFYSTPPVLCEKKPDPLPIPEDVPCTPLHFYFRDIPQQLTPRPPRKIQGRHKKITRIIRRGNWIIQE
jgi:hypothetical protein